MGLLAAAQRGQRRQAPKFPEAAAGVRLPIVDCSEPLSEQLSIRQLLQAPSRLPKVSDRALGSPQAGVRACQATVDWWQSAVGGTGPALLPRHAVEATAKPHLRLPLCSYQAWLKRSSRRTYAPR